MNQNDLLIGLNYVGRYKLNITEAFIVKKIIETPLTVKELVEETGKPFSTIFHRIRCLHLKKIIYMNKEKKGKVYYFNESTMD